MDACNQLSSHQKNTQLSSALLAWYCQTKYLKAHALFPLRIPSPWIIALSLKNFYTSYLFVILQSFYHETLVFGHIFFVNHRPPDRSLTPSVASYLKLTLLLQHECDGTIPMEKNHKKKYYTSLIYLTMCFNPSKV